MRSLLQNNNESGAALACALAVAICHASTTAFTAATRGKIA